MEPRAHHLLIGVFTIIFIVSGLGFTLWLAKHSADKQFSEYDVIFNEAVSGLSKGSSVQYSGITIGDVKSIKLDPNDPRKVRARMHVISNAPIKEDTTARFTITGITGTAIIQLDGGSPSSPKLKIKDDKIPEIIAERSPLSSLLSNSDDILYSASHLVNQANHILTDDNIDTFTQILKNVEKTTSGLAEQRHAVSKILAKVDKVSDASLKLIQSSTTLINGPAIKTLNNINRTAESLNRSSNTVAQLIDNNKESLNSGLKGLSELGPTINELKETLSTLNSFTRQLEANPSGYLLQSETIKEFKP